MTISEEVEGDREPAALGLWEQARRPSGPAPPRSSGRQSRPEWRRIGSELQSVGPDLEMKLT